MVPQAVTFQSPLQFRRQQISLTASYSQPTTSPYHLIVSKRIAAVHDFIVFSGVHTVLVFFHAVSSCSYTKLSKT